MSHVPRKEECCVTCKVMFISGAHRKSGQTGKTCPNGHFHTQYELKVQRVAYVEKRTGKATTIEGASPTSWKRRNLKLSDFGISDRVTELTVALRALIEAHDVVMRTLEPAPKLSAIVAGPFDSPMKLARMVLRSEYERQHREDNPPEGTRRQAMLDMPQTVE